MAQHDSGYVPVEYTGGLPTGPIAARAGVSSEFTYAPGEAPNLAPGVSPRQTDRTGITACPPGLYPNDAPR